MLTYLLSFFFQAEDGIRDLTVTGVQTCALPISLIEPQLATGRISVAANVFEQSLPTEYRSLFQAGEGAVDVSLPLQEVLKNLQIGSTRLNSSHSQISYAVFCLKKKK